MTITSYNPATGDIVWEGSATSLSSLDEIVKTSKKGWSEWRKLPLDDRIAYLVKFGSIVKTRSEELATTISMEMGKPLWESRQEINAMISKIEISVTAYHKRCKTQELEIGTRHSITRHMPHGVVVVIAPFNFPAHLPNGHIIPAMAVVP